MKKLKELIDKTYDTGKMPVKNMSLNDFRYLEYIHDELMKGNRVYYCFATEIINPILPNSVSKTVTSFPADRVSLS